MKAKKPRPAGFNLDDELAALRREEHDRLSKAEYEFNKVDRVCIARERQKVARHGPA